MQIKLVYYLPQSIYTVNRFCIEFEIVGNSFKKWFDLIDPYTLEITVHRVEGFYLVSGTWIDSLGNQSFESSSVQPLSFEISPRFIFDWYVVAGRLAPFSEELWTRDTLGRPVLSFKYIATEFQ